MIYEQEQNKMGSFLDGNTQGSMCVLCIAGIILMNSFLKITVAKPEYHLAILCGIRILTLLLRSPAED